MFSSSYCLIPRLPEVHHTQSLHYRETCIFIFKQTENCHCKTNAVSPVVILSYVVILWEAVAEQELFRTVDVSVQGHDV